MVPRLISVRGQRWSKLNEVLDKCREETSSDGADRHFLGSFEEIDRIMATATYRPPSKSIPNETFSALNGFILTSALYKAFGDIFSGNGAKRLHLISSVLASICALFDGDRRDKRVGIVVVKKDEFRRALAHAYVSCEVLADVDQIPVVHSIVTNFFEWVFSRSLNDKVERATPVTIAMENDAPAPKALQRIAEIMYAILADDP
ncbi:TPA: hypothetical protein N0F65_010721 [Lagenidium giganteum]|uniref:Fungal STAND N-terminal Goodbye domain-containing protein n=1 Tax=Lagenidium giganteum TaxID=4803 RepID=A0AAV2YPU9_9STRA|nr:TPA: hypothetical protein N0F65_010721 [Lagenidium giganteum]